MIGSVDFPCSDHDVTRWVCSHSSNWLSARSLAMELGVMDHAPGIRTKRGGTPEQVAACMAWLERNPETGQAPPLEKL